MRDVEEFDEQPSHLTGVLRGPRAYRGTGPASGPRPGRGRIRYAHDGPRPRVDPSRAAYPAAPAPTPSAGRRRSDVWVLVCGGIAAAAALTAAFAASGGLAGHPAAPATVPAVVSRACPSPAPGPFPAPGRSPAPAAKP